MKFVRIETKRGKSVYDGVIVSSTKYEIELLGCGPDRDSELSRHIFLKKEITIHQRDKEEVKTWFDEALANSEKKVVDAEFDVIFAKANLDRRKLFYKQVFP